MLLLADGRLQGTPIQGGTFSISIEVTDSIGGKSAVNFTLQVERKPWMAYSAKQPDGSSHAYVTDLSSSFYPYFDLTPKMPTAGHVNRGPVFSPDGSKLVLLADYTADEQNDLLFVSFNGNQVSEVKTLDTRVQDFVWSPDSSALVYDTTDDSGFYSVYAIEFNGATPASPIAIQQGIQPVALFSLAWFSNSNVGYANGYTLHVSQRIGSTYSTPTALNNSSCLQIIRQVGSRTQCSQSSINDVIFDIEAGLFVSYATKTGTSVSGIASTNLEYLAQRGNIANTIEVWSFEDKAAGKSALQVPVVGVPPAFNFGRKNLVFADTNGLTWVIDLSQAGAAPRQVTGVPANTIDYSILGNDEWLLLAGGQGLYVAPLVNTNAGVTVIPIVQLSSGTLTADGELARNRPLLAHSGPLLAAGVTELFVTELRASSVVGPTRVNSVLDSNEQFGALRGWTNDGAMVLYTVNVFPTNGGNQLYERLYLSDMTGSVPAAPGLIISYDCNGVCPAISNLTFQP